MDKVLHSSASVEWETPQKLFDTLDTEFGFDVDVCSDPEKAKCERYFTPETDGLAQDWASYVCWMNPPYGRGISSWMRKAYQTGQQGGLVVALVPSRVGTQWWFSYCANAEIRHVLGRLKFGGAKAPAPFDSSIIVFRRGGQSITSYIDRQGRKLVQRG